MNVQYLDFGRYHGKDQVQGSTFIRMAQLEKHWPKLSRYRYGDKPDALIFQKVYCTADYKFPAHYPGIRILDICDPDWFDGSSIVETCNAMDAVVVPTQAMKDFIGQFHDKVHIIADRFDVDDLPEPKKHTRKAKEVCWFGYAHNAVLMKDAMPKLDELGLKLRVIANDDPFLHQWSKQDYKEFYTFVKYNEETFYEELLKSDFVVFPNGFRPEDAYKSNNKKIKAALVGLPTATNANEVETYMDAGNRRQWVQDNYAKIKAQYDVRNSVEQYKGLINEIATQRH